MAVTVTAAAEPPPLASTTPPPTATPAPAPATTPPADAAATTPITPPAAVILAKRKCGGCHEVPAPGSRRDGWGAASIASHVRRVAMSRSDWALTREYLGLPAEDR